MIDPRWSQIKGILAAVLELEPERRGIYLDHVCAGDDALRAEVEAYLDYEPEAAEKLPVTRWSDVQPRPEPAPGAPPERLGPYRILRELGEGGMGIVYLAVRDDGAYTQQVAVKIMRSGAGAARLTELFRRERQILASLRHPGIAALMDGGATADGRLYYVLEYIQGRPVIDYCRALHGRRAAEIVRADLRRGSACASQLGDPSGHQAGEHPGDRGGQPQAAGFRAGQGL